MLSAAEIKAAVTRAATDAGFELVGIAPVDDAPELEHFPRWIAEGHAGEMKYMEARDEQGRLKRASLAHAAPWARSVVVCALNYNTAQPYSTQTPDDSTKIQARGWISRYAWSHEDYHDAVMLRLRQVEAAVRNACGTDDLITRCYVDTGPIVERVAAKYAGVGWIGKNTCIINQKLGSWIFLGVILTSLDLEPDLPAPDRCGSCTRCIEACPTDALIAPYQLDSGMGRHVFGCDICQDVCPWNRKAPTTNADELQAREELVNPALDWLAEMSAEEFRQTFRGSPQLSLVAAEMSRKGSTAMVSTEGLET